MADVFDAAGYILKKQGEMTTMKLQKLCYYSQAWSLVWDKKPLFKEDFQAWTNGPVCKELFEAHRGKYTVSSKDITMKSCLNVEQRETIDAVLKKYGKKDSQWLSTLTHLEKPWNEARKNYSEGESCVEIITKESMKKYYGSL